jgi:hypothetical protein
LAAGSKDVLPYRQSTLTDLLHESLSGNSKTCVLAAASPADCCRDETRGTLQFASRCQLVTTHTSANIDHGAQLIGSLQAENEALQLELSKLRQALVLGLPGFDINLAVSELRGSFDRTSSKTAAGSLLLEDVKMMLEQICGELSQELMPLKLLLTYGLEDHDVLKTFAKIDADGSAELDWPELESWARTEASNPRILEQWLMKMLAAREQLIWEHQEHSMDEVHRQTLEHNHALIASLLQQLEQARTELIVLYRRTGVDPSVQAALEQRREQVPRFSSAPTSLGTANHGIRIGHGFALSDAWTRCQPCRPGTAARTPTRVLKHLRMSTLPWQRRVQTEPRECEWRMAGGHDRYDGSSADCGGPRCAAGPGDLQGA